MGKRLVLLGGGHAHMTVMKRMSDIVAAGHEVALVAPGRHHYYSGMGPGLLSGVYRPQDIRFDVRCMTLSGGGRFVRARAERIDAANREVWLSDGSRLAYDVLSLNVGSEVADAEGYARGPLPPHAFPVKPIATLLDARRRLLELAASGRGRVLVAGGGAAALEMAGGVWRVFSDAGATAGLELTVLSGRRFLSKFPPRVAALARASFARRAIAMLPRRLNRLEAGVALLEDGRRLEYDCCLLCTGVTPSRLMRDSGLPTGPDGGLAVNEFLRSPDFPEIHGGGDCAYFLPRPLDKVGVYAVRQNPVLFHNLLAALEDRPPMVFDPGGPYLLAYNLGDGRAVVARKLWGVEWVFDGAAGFWLKDFLDQRFMRAFQLCGERRAELPASGDPDDEGETN